MKSARKILENWLITTLVLVIGRYLAHLAFSEALSLNPDPIRQWLPAKAWFSVLPIDLLVMAAVWTIPVNWAFGWFSKLELGEGLGTFVIWTYMSLVTGFLIGFLIGQDVRLSIGTIIFCLAIFNLMLGPAYLYHNFTFLTLSSCMVAIIAGAFYGLAIAGLLLYCEGLILLAKFVIYNPLKKNLADLAKLFRKKEVTPPKPESPNKELA